MKRKLFKQMLNEWRSNIWLVVELVIVLIVMQWIFTLLSSLYYIHKNSLPVDLGDIYVTDIRVLDENCEGYVPYDSVRSVRSDLDVMLSGLRSNPYVEIVAEANYTSLPYNYSFMGDNLMYIRKDGKERRYYVNKRFMSPELMLLFRLGGDGGETPERLAEILKKGEIIISETEYPWGEEAPTAREFMGRNVVLSSDTLTYYRVGAVAADLRRTDYEPTFAGSGYFPIRPEDVSTLVFRVKPGMGRKFIESLGNGGMQSGNVYLTDLKSLEDIRDSIQITITQAIRNIVICALFIMSVIFLGFLGTFWFRTQQRVSEIAVRKVHGARNSDIYARFFAEGLILLAVAVLITLPVSLWMMKSSLLEVIEMPIVLPDSQLIIGEILAILSLGLLIVAGIYAPARRATRVDPAEALKDM